MLPLPAHTQLCEPADLGRDDRVGIPSVERRPRHAVPALRADEAADHPVLALDPSRGGIRNGLPAQLFVQRGERCVWIHTSASMDADEGGSYPRGSIPTGRIRRCHTQRVRVAVVAEWYPSQADPVHGIWAHCQAVAAQAQGAEVRVLALRRPVPPLALARRLLRLPPDLASLRQWGAETRQTLQAGKVDGIEVLPVPWLGPPRPISYGSWGYWMAPPLHRALDRMYRAWQFDVLHAHCLAPAGHAAQRWIARQPEVGRPAFVVSAHGPDMIHVPERSSVGRRACIAALHGADLVIANSTWARRRCEELAGRALQASVVHLGANPIEASPDRDGELRLVTVGHLQARKRHDVVLRALARLAPDRRPQYLLVGDGERREPLQQLARELGIGDRVHFFGQLPNERATGLVAGCDLFVMPGVEEPFGVAFVEAMAAGVPAIGGRGEGGPEDIAAAGEGMLLVAPGNVDELAAELERLCGDRAELRRLGEAARATASASFTWERCGERTLAAYRDALACRRR
jgi:teichuronic acid biosynthesis glycosyltransferase TuaC